MNLDGEMLRQQLNGPKSTILAGLYHGAGADFSRVHDLGGMGISGKVDVG